MKNNWVKQKDFCIMSKDVYSTLLIRFVDDSYGITDDNYTTVDITWVRSRNEKIIHATTGSYSPEDILEYQEIL